MRCVLPKSLTAPERAVWAAFPRGEWVDLRVGDSKIDDPRNGHEWGPERVVRAEVIAALLLGALDAEPGKIAALRLRGARIAGQLDVSSGRIGMTMHLTACRLEEPPQFSCATVERIWLFACDLDGFGGRLLRVEGDLSLEASRVRGCVLLNHSQISGSLHLDGCRMSNPGQLALWGGGMTVGGGLFGRHGFTADGGVRLIGARIEGGLFLDGANLSNPGDVALCLDDITAPTVVCAKGFTAHGEVQLREARIRSLVNFDDATLQASESALQCQGLQAGELRLTPRKVDGLADLGLAQLGILRDDPSAWPERLGLDGLTYEHLRSSQGAVNAAARLAWLKRDTTAYRPQPYEELAAFYRRIGHDDDARRVLLAKQRARSNTLRPYARAWAYLLDWTVGHGYRPWLAGLWLLVLLAVGTAAFAAHQPRAMNPGQDPHFNPLIYTLDLLLPISPFGMRNTFIPTGSSQWLAYALIAAGWILATTLVAGIIRILRRD